MIALPAALLAAAPLLAPVPAGDIGCIESRLGAVAMARIGDGVVAAADRGTDPSAALDADRAALLAAREECRRRYGWSADAIQTAVSYTQARATRIGAEKALRADGLDLTRLASDYAALGVADRRGMVAGISPAGLAAVKAATRLPGARRHVMLYFAALAGIEFYPAGFAAG